MLLRSESGHFKSGCFYLELYLTDCLLRDFIYNKKQKILLIGFKHWEVLIAGLNSVLKTFVIVTDGN